MPRLLVHQDEEGTSAIVGYIGIHHKPDEHGALEVGYSTDPEHRQQGHATASLKIMVDLARRLPQIKILRGTIRAVGNPISERMLRGQGFRPVGEMEKDGKGRVTVYELEV